MPVYGLIKFLSTEEHADLLLSGRLLLRRLSTFKALEDAGDGRSDPYEAVSEWRQPKDIELTISAPGLPSIVLGHTDLAAPVAISMNRHEALHLFCCYAVHSGGFGDLSKKETLDEADAAELKKRLAIDPVCATMGSWAVAIRPQPFFDAITAAISARGWGADGRVVEYYDENEFSGSFSSERAPFMKRDRFSFQREFRVCVTACPHEGDELVLDVGDMSQFAWKLPTETVISTLSIEFKNGGNADRTP